MNPPMKQNHRHRQHTGGRQRGRELEEGWTKRLMLTDISFHKENG